MSAQKAEKKCFVIMPISLPLQRREIYRNDDSHFSHVFDHLLKPALEDAGYKAIPPITKGSEIIHSDIIKNLEKSDLVLADISILNPNVFFELGIRTSLNKPVCIIKDNYTDKIPFDTHLINCHTYSATLEVWDLENEKKILTEHIKSTNTEDNALWKVFGFIDQGGSNEIHDENEVIQHKDLIIEKLQLEISNLETKKLQSVVPTKYFVHKCSSCGFGMDVGEYSNTYMAYSPVSMRVSQLGLLGSISETQGVKCPKCGNVDSI